MVDSNYTLSDITKAKIGMTYDEVVKVLGEPTGSSGYGLVWQTYDLVDGSHVKMLFGSDGVLVSMCIVDIDNRVFVLKQD